MKQQISLILILSFVLVVYSSEVSFMPNYEYQPDKWYLIPYLVSFTLLLCVIFIWNVFTGIKSKKINWFFIIQSLFSILVFFNLNNPKGMNQNISFLLIIVIIASILISFRKKSKTSDLLK